MRDKEKQKEYDRQWRLNNKAKVNAAARQYYKTNLERYRANKLFFKYGLTVEAFNSLLGEQNGLCKICGMINDGIALCVDHLHIPDYESLSPNEKAKYVRGLLCNRCNTVIGLMRDNTALLKAAINYLGV